MRGKCHGGPFDRGRVVRLSLLPTHPIRWMPHTSRCLRSVGAMLYAVPVLTFSKGRKGTFVISTSPGKTEISLRSGAPEAFDRRSELQPAVCSWGPSTSWARHPFAGTVVHRPRRSNAAAVEGLTWKIPGLKSAAWIDELLLVHAKAEMLVAGWQRETILPWYRLVCGFQEPIAIRGPLCSERHRVPVRFAASSTKSRYKCDPLLATSFELQQLYFAGINSIG
jgi:hypothetical protein